MAPKTLYRGIKTLFTFEKAAQKRGRNLEEGDLTAIQNGAILESGGRVEWVGPEEEADKLSASFEIQELNVELVLPAFLECHTHSLFAGDRTEEFEMRLQGVSYQEIAKKGGGIQATVQATRQASDENLQDLLKKRLRRFRQQGVGVVEVKTGYGLNIEQELRLLRVIKSLNDENVVSTFLGPHSFSPEYPDLEAYIHDLCEVALPQIQGESLCHRVDIFIEQGFFTSKQARRYFDTAKSLGFDCVAHVEQLSHQGGIQLALQCGGRSVDHCVHASDKDIEALAKSETTAVLLPSADFYMNMAYPPARSLMDKGARVALSTDFNPGTSPSQSVELVSLLARLKMRMRLYEVLCAWTVGAAHALGIESERGSLSPGKRCDFITFNQSLKSLFYDLGGTQVKDMVLNGKRVAL